MFTWVWVFLLYSWKRETLFPKLEYRVTDYADLKRQEKTCIWKFRSSLIWVHTVCHRGFLNISADEKSRQFSRQEKQTIFVAIGALRVNLGMHLHLHSFYVSIYVCVCEQLRHCWFNPLANCNKSGLLFSSAELFKKPLWPIVWTQIRLLL